ncbi:MAG: MFS transporter [Ignavibacteriaceae bacterium]|jgi:MFS family permease|nr:MFS transporter [Ignavibacteriaceae bacterium]MCW8823231.1 MFS transporter [Ignavibacteriaceae bacterium]MCW8960588.1 MFS transporter [Ignavibacteriaceae bacterium]MCW9095425.1 MFS transporter [Ignavibacteriaceae bacterium]MCW9097105.1 MFS transporter [Ignavibacteriaceae bacterium]
MLEIQKKLTNTFYSLLALPATAMGFALSIQIAVLSWILNSQYGLDIHEIGLVWAAGPIAGIFGQVIIGFISDKVWFWGGRRRPFILIGGTLAALMIIALPNIGKLNDFLGIGSLMAVAIVVALTLDLAINISFNPTRSIIADVTPDGVPRTKGYTWMQTISGFWGVMAYAIGAIFGNYFLIYFGAIIVLAFSFIPPFFIKESKALTNHEKETVVTEKKSKVTQWGELFKLYFAHGFSWIGVQTMFVYIIAYIQQKLNPADQTETGQIIAISFLVLNAVGFILPAFVLEPITEKIGRVKTHLTCVAIMALGYFGIVLIGKSSLILYLLMAVCGIGWAAIVSLPFAIMSEKVDESRMGFFMGIFNLSVVLPQLIVSLVLGYYIQEAQDKNLIFIISGITLSISAVLWLLVKEKKPLLS